MTFFEAFPAMAAARSPFANAMATLDRSIPPAKAEVDRLVNDLAVDPLDENTRSALNVAAQALARRHKAAADLIALFLHQRVGTAKAPDPPTLSRLMSYHDSALRQAFAAKCTAVRSVYDAHNAQIRIGHLADTYSVRLFLGGPIEREDAQPVAFPQLAAHRSAATLHPV